MSEINHESVLIQIRQGLNRNNIKLWEEPYCVAGESNEAEIINLANILSQQVNIKFAYCHAAISELQNTALDNLKSIEEFKDTGIATVKVRVPCKTNGTKLLNLKIKLTESAKSLQHLIAAKLEVNADKIRIIANGKVLDLEKSLEEQNVKNNKQIMALVAEDAAGVSVEDPYAGIKKIRSEAEILLKNKNSGFLNIEDQSGKPIHLPENERRSIIMALLLYEKGRVQLKNEKFSDALILFLEADDELKMCQSNLVKSVDNVALLNLDIVWCYLNLKSIMQLPDAEARLRICEDNFKRSYGENLSRVQSVKGSAESEKGLIARLHLMYFILYFHQNRRQEAQMMMEIAEREIQELRVNEADVTLMMEMGYTKSEAVTGLRSSYNSIDGAVNFILERRQKFVTARKDGKKERSMELFINNLGISANPRNALTLHEMGFPKELCALALQKCSNDMTQALNMLQCNQNELKAELAKIIKPDEKQIEKLVSLGFDAKIVKKYLVDNTNDFQKTLDALLEMQNNFPQLAVELMNNLSDIAGCSSTAPSTSNGTSSKTPAEITKQRMDRILAEEAAFDELRNDLDHLNDDDEYLTITLEKEQMFLKQYKNALGN